MTIDIETLRPVQVIDKRDYWHLLVSLLPRGRLWVMPWPEEQDIKLGSIPSSEAWGGLTVLTDAPITTLEGIPSSEAWGLLTVHQAIELTSILTSEAWGSPTVILNPVELTSILSSEAWGTPTIAGPVNLTSIPSSEAWGVPSVAVAGAGSLSPVLEYIVDNGDGTYTSHWGWFNSYGSEQYEAIGPSNKYTPTPQDRGQPEYFFNGRGYDQFTITWDGTYNLIWTLRGKTATAGAQV